MDKCPKCGAEGKHYEFPYLFYYCGTSRCIGNQQSLECQVNQLTRKNAELEAEVQRLREAINCDQPDPNTLIWYAGKRALFHATYNGGYHDDKCREAFHHGMDTVFNALEGDAKKIREEDKVYENI